jgi:hypothetical protein
MEALEPRAGAFRRKGVRIFLVGLALAGVFLAGCSGPGPADGTLTGHLYGVGGPAPGLPRPWPGTVTLTGPGVHQDASVGADGSYSVTVPAGRYTVVGRSPLYESDAALCRATEVATVTSGHTTTADVLCQMS